MRITEVRVKLVPPGHDKLRAFCSITIDDNFVIRDLKVIEGSKGAFVAMPSRKLTNRCVQCNGKNHHRATYCNDCGRRLPVDRSPRGVGGRAKLHADIAHPINSECRNMIQRRVLEEYQEEQSRSQDDPSYRPVELDPFERDYFYDDELAEAGGSVSPAARTERAPAAPPGGGPDDGPWSSLEVPGAGAPAPGAAPRGSRTEIPESAATGGGDPPPDAGDDGSGSGRGPPHRVREVRPRRRRGEGPRPPGSPDRDDRGRGHGPPPGSRDLFDGGDRRVRDPRRREYSEETETEPEDNFGAGLFS